MMRYDVVAFLKGLDNPPPDVVPGDLPAEWEAVYRERAAAHERSAGVPRELAEHFALLDTLEQMKLWQQHPTS
ncbi:hypothetical protein J8F10_07030 [Gemmata sp. G18]|uniref:Uncharacterized protein n=1 Tax=Gemmata palustris TaxID=2822762 RepID=A0ABS5BMS2_9BACT|nr:hypothetical protein [Gemmata palustris]MBP3955034.1 hypothetical protein [Gemmata palustris]